jgi:fatty acid desaturase
MRVGLLRYSGWDLLCVATVPLHCAILVALAWYFRGLTWPWLVAAALLLFLISIQNTGANHNHYHTPIFRSERLNRLLTVAFAMASGSAKEPFNIAHGVHHDVSGSFNHWRVRDVVGLSAPLARQLKELALYAVNFVVPIEVLKDWRYLEKGAVDEPPDAPRPKEAEEALARAQSHGTRQDLIREVSAKVDWIMFRDPESRRAYLAEIVAIYTFRWALCAIDWRFALAFLLPVSFVVGKVRALDNYVQHWGATDPEDPKRDSVSCYGLFYNCVTFNLGYHQEHHLRRGVHWLKLPRTRGELSETGRRTVPFMHYVNVPLFYPRESASLAALAKQQRS